MLTKTCFVYRYHFREVQAYEFLTKSNYHITQGKTDYKSDTLNKSSVKKQKKLLQIRG
jgi:hypothetical protein